VECGRTGVECGWCWCEVWEVLVWSMGGAGVECGRCWCGVWEVLVWEVLVWSMWRETKCKGCR